MPSPSARVGLFWDMMEGRVPMPPAARLLGWQLVELDPQAGTICVRFDAKAEFANPLGNIQGGFIAAMLDEAMGPAMVATLPPGDFAPTLEMKISYLEPVKVGPLWAYGRVVKRASAHGFVEAELLDEAGTVLARASATVRLRSRR
jgi:uncharacterized protein (TIGR00369 family)